MSRVRMFRELRMGIMGLRALANKREVRERFLQLLQAYIDEQIKYDPTHAEIRIYVPVNGGRVILFKDLAVEAEKDEEVFKWLWALLSI